LRAPDGGQIGSLARSCTSGNDALAKARAGVKGDAGLKQSGRASSCVVDGL